MPSDDEKDMESTETEDHEYRLRDCKQEKRIAKSQMTRLLNKLASVLSEDNLQNKIKELLEKIQEQQEETLMVMSRLEKAYHQKNDTSMAEKVSDEADDLVEQIDRETMPARSLLASLTKVKSRTNSVADSEASQRRKEKEKAEMEARLRRDRLEWEIEQNREELERQEKELQAVNEEINKRRQELENEVDEHLILEQEFTEEYHPLPSQQNKSIGNPQQQQENKVPQKSPDHVHAVETPSPEMPKSHRPINVSDAGSIANNREMHGQLERIRIPIFSGNKMDFQRWNAAFTSCVDMTSLSPQFKMLRLEACLAGEAANTIKGLGYSLEAYEAAKTCLFRKYGGSRRQVQSHIEELKRLQPIQENNAKELETFADVLERAVITLKENGRKSDLEGGALHTMILEKIPERLLAQYYRWLDENKH